MKFMELATKGLSFHKATHDNFFKFFYHFTISDAVPTVSYSWGMIPKKCHACLPTN